MVRQFRMVMTATVIGTVLLAGPAPAGAQPRSGSSDSARTTVFAQVPRGAWMRIASGQAVMTGTLQRVDSGIVVLRVRGGTEQSLDTRTIHAAWVQRGRTTGVGMRWGALGGGGAGAGLGFLAGGFGCADDSKPVARSPASRPGRVDHPVTSRHPARPSHEGRTTGSTE